MLAHVPMAECALNSLAQSLKTGSEGSVHVPPARTVETELSPALSKSKKDLQTADQGFKSFEGEDEGFFNLCLVQFF